MSLRLLDSSFYVRNLFRSFVSLSVVSMRSSSAFPLRFYPSTQYNPIHIRRSQLPSIQFFWRAMSSGILARTALIASVYRRGVTMSPSMRASANGSKGGYGNSRLLHFVSGDVSRVDAASQWFVSRLSGFLVLIVFGSSSRRFFSIPPLHTRLRIYTAIYTDTIIRSTRHGQRQSK